MLARSGSLPFRGEVTVETHDSQDHSYAGVMFNVECKPAALQYLELSALWVRGDLGPITVWATPGSFEESRSLQSIVKNPNRDASLLFDVSLDRIKGKR